MSSKRFEGKNLEEALDSAARTFGVERFRLSYHVVLEKRGFLGGTKRVVVEAEVSDAGGAPKTETPKPSARPHSRPRERERSAAPRREEPAAAATHSAAAADEPESERAPSGRSRRRGRRRGRGASRNEPRSRQEEPRESEPEPVGRSEAPEQGSRSAEAAAVAEWCEKVIGLAGLELVVRTSEQDEEIMVELYGSDAPRLQDKGGELLDSLQVLLNKALVGRSVEKRIELDVEGFKSKRAADLTARALELATRVREEGRERTLPAMTPIERRIIHLALQDEEGVETESRGRGFHKRVAIMPSEEGGAAVGES
jgi:spoIIIJ-associated protein